MIGVALARRSNRIKGKLNSSTPYAPKSEGEVKARLHEAANGNASQSSRIDAQLQNSEAFAVSKSTEVTQSGPEGSAGAGLRPESAARAASDMPLDLESGISTSSVAVDLEHALRELMNIKSAATARVAELRSVVASASDDTGLVRASANALGDLVALEVNERARSQPMRIGEMVVSAVNRARAGAAEVSRPGTFKDEDMPDLIALRRIIKDFEQDLKRSPAKERTEGRPDIVLAALEAQRSLAQWSQERDSIKICSDIDAGIGSVRVSGRNGQLKIEVNRAAIRQMKMARLSEYLLSAICRAEAEMRQCEDATLGRIQTMFSPLSFWIEELG